VEKGQWVINLDFKFNMQSERHCSSLREKTAAGRQCLGKIFQSSLKEDVG